ncbi:MAG: F0F1 ATP synthase subunit A [Candidatus Hydrogenedentes bacterium]|nr:F0F1 ATP synthase subunit A [Candidatus Hydrogenedentota bacterium]
MEAIGSRWVIYYIPGTDIPLPLGGLNIFTVLATLIILSGITLIGYTWTHHFQTIPNRKQALLEIIMNWFIALIEPILETSESRVVYEVIPFILSLFSFILVGILFSILPLPYIEEPTSDINCTLALGIITIIFSWILSIRFKGIHGLLREFKGPLYDEGSAGKKNTLIAKLSVVFFFPFKIIEEISKIISLSCRLFGNSLGSSIVTTVISNLCFYFAIPIILDVLLTGFESFIQAFVFASLTTVYISSYLSEENSKTT